MATRLARRHRAIAVVALVAISGSPALGGSQPPAHAAPDTTSDTEPADDDEDQSSEPGTGPQLPDAVTFDPTAVGAVSQRRVTLTNGLATPVTITELTVFNANGTEVLFALDDDGCTGTTLEQGSSCAFHVTFAPREPGERFGGLTASVVGAEPPDASTLSGTGVPQPPNTEPVDPPETSTPQTTTTNPGDGPSGPGEEPDDLEARTRECERLARRAEVRYPDMLEMTVGRESSVAVTVTLEGATPPSTAEGTPDTVVDSATLTCFVTAVLSGSNFDIDPASQSGDFVLSSTIDWRWDVTPKTTGRHDLDLRIIPQIGIGADSSEGTPRTFQADITVTAEPRSAWEVISDFFSDVAQNPLFKFLVAAGVLSGIGAAIKKRFGSAISRRRGHKAGKDDHKSGYL